MAKFSDAQIEQVWNKAYEIAGYDPAKWKKDFAGAWIGREYYGMTGSFGWEIDHLKPVVLGGSDALENLNALHWQNNRRKGDDYPKFSTIIRAQGDRNVEELRNWQVS